MSHQHRLDGAPSYLMARVFTCYGVEGVEWCGAHEVYCDVTQDHHECCDENSTRYGRRPVPARPGEVWTKGSSLKTVVQSDVTDKTPELDREQLHAGLGCFARIFHS